MATESLNLGDRVKASTGEEGELVVLNADGTTAYVRLSETDSGAVIRRLPLSSLTTVEVD
jgi:hypothetical protein